MGGSRNLYWGEGGAKPNAPIKALIKGAKRAIFESETQVEGAKRMKIEGEAQEKTRGGVCGGAL